jgi:hypothetical protein
MKSQVAEQREKLYREFGNFLTMQHGPGNGSIRMIRLTTLLCDVKVGLNNGFKINTTNFQMYTTAYEDTYSLLGIFLPADRYAFWSNKPNVSDSQLINLAFAPIDLAQQI